MGQRTTNPISLADLEAEGSLAANALDLAFATRSYCVLALPEPLLDASLSRLAARLGSFYGCSPRYHEFAGTSASGFQRRILMHYDRDGGRAACIPHEGRWPEGLASCAEAMADADPLLIRAARAVIKALGRSCPALAEHAMTTGQCDAFY